MGLLLTGFAAVSAVQLVGIKTIDLLPGSGIHSQTQSESLSLTHSYTVGYTHPLTLISRSPQFTHITSLSAIL